MSRALAKSAAGQQPITIRPFTDLAEMRVCEELQRQVWQYAEGELVPQHVFVVAQKTGGEVLGAFQGDRAIGFTLAFPAVNSSGVYLHSHMAAVLPERQNRGVGRSLKLAQREHALARGIDLIEWTFDPLQIKNAHFNIARLGVIARRYAPDLYGRTSSRLHRGLPTDRLVAEWRLNSARVARALAGNAPPISERGERITMPADIGEICRSHPAAAEQVQARLRGRFQELFQESYAVTGFESGEREAAYVLEPYED